MPAELSRFHSLSHDFYSMSKDGEIIHTRLNPKEEQSTVLELIIGSGNLQSVVMCLDLTKCHCY